MLETSKRTHHELLMSWAVFEALTDSHKLNVQSELATAWKLAIGCNQRQEHLVGIMRAIYRISQMSLFGSPGVFVEEVFGLIENGAGCELTLQEAEAIAAEMHINGHADRIRSWGGE